MNNRRTPPRVLAAALFHETHTFLEGATRWDDFLVKEGVAMLDVAGDASPLGGFLEFAEQADWEIAPTISAVANPSATVCDEVVERFWERLAAHAAAQVKRGVDALFLVLHGAFASESVDDVDGEILRRLRSLPGVESLPIFGVYDLHANFSLAMAEHADCLVAYRENPHADARLAAQRAAGLLDRAMRSGVRPRQFVARPPLVLPPTATGSAANPMKGWLARARELEERYPEFWCVNVNAGFAYADSADVGVSFSLVCDGAANAAQTALDEFAASAMEQAGETDVVDLAVDEAMTQLERFLDDERPPRPTLLVEPSDNIGGGAPGDGTTLLRVLLERDINNAAICLWDPQAVARLEKANEGDRVTMPLGGRGSTMSEGPVERAWEFVRRFDGLFELEDKQSHLASMCGDRFDMGRCAIVRCQGVTVLLTSRRTPPMDLGQWRRAGLPPEAFAVIVVKAAVAHRKAYDPIAAKQFWVDTPGPCSSQLRRFPYRKIRRPIYPLDAP